MIWAAIIVTLTYRGHPDMAYLVALGLGTYARPSELLGLRKQDVIPPVRGMSRYGALLFAAVSDLVAPGGNKGQGKGKAGASGGIGEDAFFVKAAAGLQHEQKLALADTIQACGGRFAEKSNRSSTASPTPISWRQSGLLRLRHTATDEMHDVPGASGHSHCSTSTAHGSPWKVPEATRKRPTPWKEKPQPEKVV